MDIREIICRHPRTGLAIGVGFGALGLTLAIMLLKAAGSRRPASWTNAFYTIDDGQTLFVDDAHRIPPFEHGGAEALRAVAYSLNGHRWVQFLEKYTAEQKKRLEEGAVDDGRGRLVKKPGGGEWIASGTPGAADIVNPVAPDGAKGQVEIAMP